MLSEVRVSSDHTVLYFPLKNALDSVVGYRKMQAGREEETECHGLHTGGLFSCRATKATRGDQAVLVPSIQDVLNLAAHKTPGSYHTIWSTFDSILSNHYSLTMLFCPSCLSIKNRDNKQIKILEETLLI